MDKNDNIVRKSLAILLAIFLYQFMTNFCWCNFLIIVPTIVLLMSERSRKYLRIISREIRTVGTILTVAKRGLPHRTITTHFQNVCQSNPDKVMVQFQDEAWTFRQVDEYSNQIGNFLSAEGVREGDNVAVFMSTQIEHVTTWLGILKIGATASLININLRGTSLLHCIQTVPPKCIIYSEDLEEAITEILAEFANLKLYCFRNLKNQQYKGNAMDLKAMLKTTSTAKPPSPVNVTTKSKAIYLFTSGTTGLPKAAIITHERYVFLSIGINCFGGIKSSDIIYIALPLYHANGTIVGMGQAILRGSSVALRTKFSTTHFWSDCIRYNATVLVYIGEICRFLINAPLRAEETSHKIRLIAGNGLRPDIWENFITRFNIPQVLEFYGSTEGIGSLINGEGKVGAVGYKFYLLPLSSPKLIKVDPATEQPVRKANGLCIQVTKAGEPGMHVTAIRNFPGSRFDGYADKSATEKKIIENVFKHGDRYYSSGDLFTLDDEGFYYFRDRLGDTYRWRGENVATAEVERIISGITSLATVAVYGVEVPGEEGKAGMAAITDPNASINLQNLTKEITSLLPKYAQPQFLRLIKEMPLTGTYKIQKKQFKDEGYNPNVVKDSLFYYDVMKHEYLPLTLETYDNLQSKKIKL